MITGGEQSGKLLGQSMAMEYEQNGETRLVKVTTADCKVENDA